MRAKREVRPLPSVGVVFVFPVSAGLSGACRVLRSREGRCLLALTEWTGADDPSPEQASLRRIQRLTHHNLPGQLAVSNAVEGPPPEFRQVGGIAPTPSEAELETDSYGAWGWIAAQRKLQSEWDGESAPQSPRPTTGGPPAARPPLPLDVIREAARIHGWRGHVTEEAVLASVDIIQATVDSLKTLGSNPGRRAVLKAIRAGVESFNRLDRRLGFIETIEREDIGESFNAMAEACGVQSDDVTARWREW